MLQKGVVTLERLSCDAVFLTVYRYGIMQVVYEPKKETVNPN